MRRQYGPPAPSPALCARRWEAGAQRSAPRQEPCAPIWNRLRQNAGGGAGGPYCAERNR